MATGQLRITPGIILGDNTEITTSVLNSIANPTAIINSRAVTARELHDDIVYPSVNDTLSGSPLAWTMIAGRAFQFASHTLTGNRTLSFSGHVTGMFGCIILKQDATGGRTITLPATSIVENGGAGSIALSSAANAIDIIYWWYDGVNIWWAGKGNFT